MIYNICFLNVIVIKLDDKLMSEVFLLNNLY